MDCQLDCNRQFAAALNQCPCYDECPNGCDACANDICDNKKLRVLVLNSSYGSQFLLRPYEPAEANQVDFNYESDTEAYFSCGATYRGKSLVFGGVKQTRQISQVTSCGLVRIGNLRNDFSRGSCAAVDGGDYVALCFSKGTKTCLLWRDDEYALPEAQFKHDYTSIAVVNRTIVAVGDSSGTTAETLDLLSFPFGEDQLQWQLKAEFPYSTTYKNYATVGKDDAAYYFGGYNGAGMMNIITRFDLNTWSTIGELNKPRDFHSVALVGGRFLVVGGESYEKTLSWRVNLFFRGRETEFCHLHKGTIDCIDQSPTLQDNYKPVLLMVDADMC